MNQLGMIISDTDYMGGNMYKLAMGNGANESMYNLAHLYEANEKYNDALDYYLKCIKNTTNVAYKAIIRIDKKLGKHEDALLFRLNTSWRWKM